MQKLRNSSVLYYKKRNPVEYKRLWNVKFPYGLLSDETKTLEEKLIFLFLNMITSHENQEYELCKVIYLSLLIVKSSISAPAIIVISGYVISEKRRTES